jgi:hypothetical protein
MKTTENARISPVEDCEVHLRCAQDSEKEIASGKAGKTHYDFNVANWSRVAIGRWAQHRDKESLEAARSCINAVLEYFCGEWRERVTAPNGKTGTNNWEPYCLWYEEVQCSLPFASALLDWEAVRKIAAYPPEDKLPEAAKAKGETAWGWALITYLRGEPRKKVEAFVAKAEGEKAKRPKLLAPVLRALMDEDAKKFAETLLVYLAYYRKSEFKTELDKAIALDGTTLYHLGRKLGFKVELPEAIANHVIRFE